MLTFRSNWCITKPDFVQENSREMIGEDEGNFYDQRPTLTVAILSSRINFSIFK